MWSTTSAVSCGSQQGCKHCLLAIHTKQSALSPLSIFFMYKLTSLHIIPLLPYAKHSHHIPQSMVRLRSSPYNSQTQMFISHEGRSKMRSFESRRLRQKRKPIPLCAGPLAQVCRIMMVKVGGDRWRPWNQFLEAIRIEAGKRHVRARQALPQVWRDCIPRVQPRHRYASLLCVRCMEYPHISSL